MERPAERPAVQDRILDIEPRAAVDQQPDHGRVAAEDRLVRRRAMGMIALRITTVRIFAGVEQRAPEAGRGHEIDMRDPSQGRRSRVAGGH